MSKRILSNIAYRAIKERISTMPSGSYLSARQCALELDMSYTPVREAFLRLQKEGVLRQVPNVGFFVKNVDLTDLFQMFQVRECVEIFALKKTFGKLSEIHTFEMRKLYNDQEAAREVGDSYRYAELDALFHRIPVALLGNRALLTLYDDMRAQYQIVSGSLLPLIDREVQQENIEFIEAVTCGEQGKAEDILLRHIQGIKTRIIHHYVNDHME